MGENTDTKESASPETLSELPGKCDFSLTVIEHLSWDAYDKEKKCFTPCDAKNKPIVNRKFQVKMPNGSIVPMETDANGLIEIKGEDPNAKFEVTFEPENVKLNNKYYLFHNDSAVVKPLESK